MIKKSIAFIGDSFCNNYDMALWAELKYPLHQRGQPATEVYPSIVAEHFNYLLYPYGYGGKSWWYSRQHFMNHWEWRWSEMEQTFDAIVFCHTNGDRINNSWNENILTINRDNTVSKEVEQSVNLYYKHIHDAQYAYWSLQQWFKEIADRFKNIRTLHFHCFPFTLEHTNLLPGTVFDTPLMTISLGELTGTQEEILEKCAHKETRANHMSVASNQQLARVIIQHLEDYAPGHRLLDIAAFNLPNKNADRYPDGKFWTP